MTAAGIGRGARRRLQADVDQIQRTLERFSNGGPVEIRIPDCPRAKVTTAGYFDHQHLAEAARRAATFQAAGVYFVFNRIHVSAFARIPNRFEQSGAGAATSDGDIVDRCWLLLDFDDHTRVAGVSATAEEKEAARIQMEACREFLAAAGWVAPIVCDSGNGYHLLYPINLLNDRRTPGNCPNRALIKAVLMSLDSLFSTATIQVDQSVFNAARITKLYGTVSAKGADLEDRPHRLTAILEDPGLRPGEIVTREQLQAVADLLPQPAQRGAKSGAQPFDIETWLLTHNLPVDEPTDYNGGLRWRFQRDAQCPFGGPHNATAAFILRLAGGALSAGCLHSGCRGQGWKELRALFEPGWQPGTATNQTTGGDRDRTTQEWEELIEFDWQADLPPFPIEVLRPIPWLFDFITEISVATQTPVEAAAFMTLAALATANAKHADIDCGGWKEPLNLYLLVALLSGERKTAVVNAAAEPLRAWQREEAARAKARTAENQPELRIALARRTYLERKIAAAGRNAKTHFEREELKEINQQIELLVVPNPRRLLADDITNEKLGVLLNENGERLALLSDEGGVFALINGLYQAAGKSPNYSIYLQAHSGSPVLVDRVSREPISLWAPALTLGLSIQPHVIQTLSEIPGVRDRGLAGRFLYAIPASLMGHRKNRPRPMSVGTQQTFNNNVRKLIDLPVGDEPWTLKLSEPAQQLFDDFREEVEPQLGPDGALDDMTDWASKLPGEVGRLLGNLHIAAHVDQTNPFWAPVDLELMGAAITIGRYLIPHAQAALYLMGAEATIADARWLVGWLQRKHKLSFTRRDASRAGHRRFKRVTALDPVLELLTQQHYIRRQSDPPGGAHRPSSPGFEVNPEVFAKAKVRPSDDTSVTSVTANEPPPDENLEVGRGGTSVTGGLNPPDQDQGLFKTSVTSVTNILDLRLKTSIYRNASVTSVTDPEQPSLKNIDLDPSTPRGQKSVPPEAPTPTFPEAKVPSPDLRLGRCEGCFFVHDRADLACPNCGLIPESAPEQTAKIVENAGVYPDASEVVDRWVFCQRCDKHHLIDQHDAGPEPDNSDPPPRGQTDEADTPGVNSELADTPDAGGTALDPEEAAALEMMRALASTGVIVSLAEGRLKLDFDPRLDVGRWMKSRLRQEFLRLTHAILMLLKRGQS